MCFSPFFNKNWFKPWHNLTYPMKVLYLKSLTSPYTVVYLTSQCCVFVRVYSVMHNLYVLQPGPKKKPIVFFSIYEHNIWGIPINHNLATLSHLTRCVRMDPVCASCRMFFGQLKWILLDYLSCCDGDEK